MAINRGFKHFNGCKNEHDEEYLADITDEQLHDWEQEINEVTEFNNNRMAELRVQLQEIVDKTKALFGENSNEHKYMKNKSLPYKPTYYFNSYKRKVEEARRNQEILRRNKEAEVNKTKLMEEACVWLAEHGKVLGKDFTLDNAVLTANAIALEKAVEARIKHLDENGEWQSFDGWNCGDLGRDCEGWDGKSNRCDCGNRRVCWCEGWDHSFKNPHANAEAY